MKIMFISSTGGHLTELLKLSKLFDKYDFCLITEKTSNNKKLKELYPSRVSYLVHGSKEFLFTYIFKFIYNSFKSLFLYLKYHPDYIITTGAHTSVVMSYIGKIFGSKIVYIETFANINSKSMSGKLTYPIADLFIVQWEEMLKLYPKAKYYGGVF